MSERPVAGDGLIDPERFPVRSRDLDLDAVRDSADAVRRLGRTVSEEADQIGARWAGLGAVYEAPESEIVLSLMGPAVATGQEVDEACRGTAKALNRYADDLAVLKSRLADLERRAQEFRDRVKHGVQTSLVGEVNPWMGVLPVAIGAATDGMRTVPWFEHGPSIKTNEDLLLEHAKLLEQGSQAAAICADEVNRAGQPRTCMAQTHVVSADQVMAAGPMPWGEPRGERRGAVEQISDGYRDYLLGMVHAAGSLVVGYDPATGGFSPETARAAWGGVGNLLGSALVVLNPATGAVLGVIDALGVEADGGALGWLDERRTVVLSAGGSMVGWDPTAQDGWHQWKAEPFRAGTSSALNVGTFFVPAAGAAKVGTAGARGAVGLERAGTVARGAGEMLMPGGSWAVRAFEAAGKTRTVSWMEATTNVRLTLQGRTGMGFSVARALDELSNTTPPVVNHPPNMPRVTDSIRVPDAVQVSGGGAARTVVDNPGRSWLYQEKPVEPLATARADVTPDGHALRDRAVGKDTEGRDGQHPDKTADLGSGRADDTGKDLTQAGRNATHDYTGPGYHEINNAPRDIQGSEQFFGAHGLELRPVDGLPFTGGLSSMRGVDIARQGALGDCSVIATLNSLGHRAPHVLESRIVSDGSTARVGDLTVTRELPTGRDGSTAPIATSSDGSTWVSLTERAISERRGGYDSWEQGGMYPRDAFATLTGTPSRTLYPSTMDDATIARHLAEPNKAMVASVREIIPNTPAYSLMNAYGLFGNHAYSIRGVDARGNVLLHNPWGHKHPRPVPIDTFKELFSMLDIWP
ncbi:MAG: C2 family cysteine protease [Micrococcales bacterium]|nr:C2 family cysteine protease [Micrococcales bacterium]